MSISQRSDLINGLKNKSPQKRVIFNRPFFVVLVIMAIPFVYMKFRYKSLPPAGNLETRVTPFSVSTSPNGRYAFFCGNRAVAWLVDLPFFRVIQNIPLKSDAAFAVDLSFDATHAAIYEANDSISVWNLETKQKTSSFSISLDRETQSKALIKRKHPQIALSPDASKLLLHKPKVGLFLLDAQSGKTLLSFERDESDPIQWFDFLPNGRRLIWYNGSGFFFQNVNGGEISKIPFDSAELQAFLFAPDGNALYAGSKSGFVYRIDIPLNKYEFLFHHPNPVSALNFMDNGWLLVGGERGYVAIWNPDGPGLIDSFYRESTAICGMHWGGERRPVSVFDRGGRAWGWYPISESLSVCDGFKDLPDGDLVYLPPVSMRGIKRPKPVDLNALLHTPLQHSFRWNEEGIDLILFDLSDAIEIPICIPNDVSFKHQYREPIDSALILDAALRHFSLEHRIRTDGSIHIGRPKTLHALEGVDSRKTLSDFPELQENRFDRVECMYVSDLIKKIDPDGALKFVLEEDAYSKITLELNRPTPIQILEAVLHPNRLDFGIQNRQIVVGKKGEEFQYNRTILQNTVDESVYRIRSKISKYKTYDWDGEELRDVLSDLRLDFNLDCTLDKGVENVVLNIEIQPMPCERVLDSILHPHGLDWVYEREGTYRFGRIDDLETDANLLFSPKKLTSFIIAYHSRFKTSELKYAGTESCRGNRGMEEIKQKNSALSKTIERARVYAKEKKGFFSDGSMSDYEYRIFDEWVSMSDENVKKILDVRKRLESDVVRDVTKIYSTDSSYRCAEIHHPNDLPDYCCDVLNERGETMWYSSPIGSINESRQSLKMKCVDFPCRFGADLDWFLQCGYQIDIVDWTQRTIQLSDAADAGKTLVYRFTLLDGHNAYWKQMDVLINGRVVRRILSDDFIDVSGLLVPQSVRIQDSLGSDFFYLDFYAPVGDFAANILASPDFYLRWGGFRSECNLKLLDANVNQTILKKYSVR